MIRWGCARYPERGADRCLPCLPLVHQTACVYAAGHQVRQASRRARTLLYQTVRAPGGQIAGWRKRALAHLSRLPEPTCATLAFVVVQGGIDRLGAQHSHQRLGVDFQ